MSPQSICATGKYTHFITDMSSVQSFLTCLSVSSIGLYPEAGLSLLYGSSAIYAHAKLNKCRSSNRYE